MNTDQLIAFAAVILVLIGWLARITWIMAQLSTKVDTMWDFQIRRSMSEVVEKGIGKMNSPLTFTGAAMDSLNPLKEALIRWWKTEGNKLSDGSALLEIEKRFGDMLLTQVCVPLLLSHGACLILALAVARETHTIEVSLGSDFNLPRDVTDHSPVTSLPVEK